LGRSGLEILTVAICTHCLIFCCMMVNASSGHHMFARRLGFALRCAYQDLGKDNAHVQNLQRLVSAIGADLRPCKQAVCAPKLQLESGSQEVQSLAALLLPLASRCEPSQQDDARSQACFPHTGPDPLAQVQDDSGSVEGSLPASEEDHSLSSKASPATPSTAPESPEKNQEGPPLAKSMQNHWKSLGFHWTWH